MDEQEKLETQQQAEEKKKNWWHPPFYEGLKAVLDPSEDHFRFQDEYRLSKESLRIDVMITKKGEAFPVNHEIAELFKGHNLVEYKPHNDSLGLSDYERGCGYAHLYAAFRNIPRPDITITFAATMHPRKLINYLKKERDLIVRDKGKGVYYIDGDCFPVQIVVCKQNDNLILRSLHDSLEPAELAAALQAFEAARPGVKNVYTERLIMANLESFREVAKMYPDLKERFIEIAEEDGWLEERDMRTAIEMAERMLAKGMSHEDVADITKLSIGKISKLQPMPT